MKNNINLHFCFYCFEGLMLNIHESIPDINGKCISVKTKGLSEDSIEINNPVFEKQLGRIFITGISPDGATESGWLKGKTVSVAWEQVAEYYVFENEKIFKESADCFRQFYKKLI